MSLNGYSKDIKLTNSTNPMRNYLIDGFNVMYSALPNKHIATGIYFSNFSSRYALIRVATLIRF